MSTSQATCPAAGCSSAAPPAPACCSLAACTGNDEPQHRTTARPRSTPATTRPPARPSPSASPRRPPTTAGSGPSPTTPPSRPTLYTDVTLIAGRRRQGRAGPGGRAADADRAEAGRDRAAAAGRRAADRDRQGGDGRPASRSSTWTGSSPTRARPGCSSRATTTAWASPPGTYIGSKLKGKSERGHRRDRRHRQPAADPGPVARLQGRAGPYGLKVDQPGRRPVHRRSPARTSRPTCCRPRRRSTRSGTTTTTRASACSPPSSRPTARSSSWSAAPARWTRWSTSRPATRRWSRTVTYPPTHGLVGDLAGPPDRPGQGHVRPGRAAGAASRSCWPRRRSRRTTWTSTCRSASSPSRPRTGSAAPCPPQNNRSCGSAWSATRSWAPRTRRRGAP